MSSNVDEIPPILSIPALSILTKPQKSVHFSTPPSSAVATKGDNEGKRRLTSLLPCMKKNQMGAAPPEPLASQPPPSYSSPVMQNVVTNVFRQTQPLGWTTPEGVYYSGVEVIRQVNFTNVPRHLQDQTYLLGNFPQNTLASSELGQDNESHAKSPAKTCSDEPPQAPVLPSSPPPSPLQPTREPTPNLEEQFKALSAEEQAEALESFHHGRAGRSQPEPQPDAAQTNESQCHACGRSGVDMAHMGPFEGLRLCCRCATDDHVAGALRRTYSGEN